VSGSFLTSIAVFAAGLMLVVLTVLVTTHSRRHRAPRLGLVSSR
jgi:hypothetical protein